MQTPSETMSSEQLSQRFEEIKLALMDRYKKYFKEIGQVELKRVQQEQVEKYGLLDKIEGLDLTQGLALWINDLRQQRLLNESEALF